MTDFNKLADALESNSRFVRHGVSSHGDAELMLQAARILRAAGAADVGGLIEIAAKAIYDSWFTQPGFVAWMPGGNSHKQTEARDIARAALESALRVALAPKAGFVMVPRDGVEQIADALADVLATFQHAEPEALKAAIRHSNKSAHAAYTLVYGLLFAAQPGAQESAK